MSGQRPKHNYLTVQREDGFTKLTIYWARDDDDAIEMAVRDGAAYSELDVKLLASKESRAILEKWFRRDYISTLMHGLGSSTPWTFTVSS